jgi:hypothetical protein
MEHILVLPVIGCKNNGLYMEHIVPVYHMGIEDLNPLYCRVLGQTLTPGLTV